MDNMCASINGWNVIIVDSDGKWYVFSFCLQKLFYHEFISFPIITMNAYSCGFLSACL